MRFILYSALFVALIAPSSAIAHDGGDFKHKNRYLRTKVIKLYDSKAAPGCNLVARECKAHPNPGLKKVRRYFNTMRRMIVSKQAASYLNVTRPYQPPAGTMTTRATSAPLTSIKQCESGGNYSAVNPTGKYRGAYQFSYRTWQSVGGSGDPAAASPAEQDKRAAILYARSGPAPWPVCGYR